ncbi:uncharacterized protein FA14DRAFT_146072 [Meira miltonrushii]|uniref:ERCC4 domain-containing protein n=1 Tax=Meira miltonrushii TaxID=1280837 RepID=A0A316VEC5_9BASI|nr:uncharacterized protein FA14DRAFT_146072 [Meira miltonrushii]PWN35969.1 hypothetical protein FA14DRAFT_146072 [Meira miltonrushii]
MEGGADVTSKDIGHVASVVHLLPFQRQIIHSLIPGARQRQKKGKDQKESSHHDDDDPDVLLILARGLGLRTIIASILRLYDGPTNLVILVNAKSTREEDGLREELKTMGVKKPGLQSISHHTTSAQRQEMYLNGGLVSVTSRILVVDMLNGTVPTDLITGLVVMHAESITPTCTESFIVRLYRDKNKDGFLKAFSDSPDHFGVGLSPLQTVLTQLKVRRVELWPRFHKDIIRDLGKKKSDVIELHQDLSRSMREIQSGIYVCLDAVLNELKKNTGSVDIDDATMENAIFPRFERVIRQQLDAVWHKISPKSKRLVADLKLLRTMLDYLLSYDAVRFQEYLETILLSQHNPANPNQATNYDRSQWLTMDAANVIFKEAKARVYRAQDANSSKRPSWLPPGIETTLEELPKWRLLREVLDEIEQDIHWSSTDLTKGRNNTVLIMVRDEAACRQVREYVSTMRSYTMGSAEKDDRPGRKMMEYRFREYLTWKQGVKAVTSNFRNPRFTSTNAPQPINGTGADSNSIAANRSNGTNGPAVTYENPALGRKEIWEGGRAPAYKRRRQRGGAMMGSSSSTRRDPVKAAEMISREAEDIDDHFRTSAQGVEDGEEDEYDATYTDMLTNNFTSEDFENYFRLLTMEDFIVIRPYTDDDDDHHLQELKPRFVIMYDANPAFIRRLEVYRTAMKGVEMRIYFLMYADSVEEQRYLSQIRREKECFERFIREKANMALPLQADGSAANSTAEERSLRAINSRLAGGQLSATNEQPRVIVDMREFRSSLPFKLHEAGMLVVPCTLTVGDYILSNLICVERKSLSDLVQSFNSGRLYVQCEMMSANFQHPVLLIEFEQNKSFALQTINDSRGGGANPMNKKIHENDVQSKLVLLTLSFPRLRIVWSSSPYATADIFAELKQNFEEPDEAIVSKIGTNIISNNEADGAQQANEAPKGLFSVKTTGIEDNLNTTLQEILLSLPGITTKNYMLIIRSVRDLADLCEMTVDEITHLIGKEAGRKLFNFLHKDARAEAKGANSI